MKATALGFTPRGTRRRTLALAATLALFCGCESVPNVGDLYPVLEHKIPRNRVSDFFAKDFDLPDFRPRAEAFARERHRVKPGPAAAALGDAAGTLVGGYRNDWHAGAGAALGDAGGAATGEAFARATEIPPLPRDYSGIEVPIPVIATDPNAGITVGIMPVSVFREADTRITNIFAPQITWNEIDGPGALFRMRRFFTTDSLLSIDAGSTLNGAHNYDLQYKQARFGPEELLVFRARMRYVTELSDRFYGLGSESRPENESNYTFHRAEALSGFGVLLPFWSRVELAELLSTSSVGPGHISNLPSSTIRFRRVRGMRDRFDLLSHRVTFTFDTRDQLQATNNGILGELYYEISDATLGSDISYHKIGLTLSGVVSYVLDVPFLPAPIEEMHLATAGRVCARWVAGRHLPFYELTTIGGKTTLRGYGDGRFVGKNGFCAGVEERWNIWTFTVKKTDLVLQVAGFGECGRVYGGRDHLDWQQLRFAAGGAVRLIIPKSDIVVSLDTGASKEGVQTFLDLGYPF